MGWTPQRREDPRFYEAIGRAIKVLRAQQGKGRRELADAARISYPYLSEIENGKKRASSKALVAIAGAVGLRPSQLFELAEALVAQIDEAPIPEPELMSDPESMAQPLASALPAYEAAMEPKRGGPTWSLYRPAVRFQESSPSDSEDRVAELMQLAANLSDDDIERLTDLARRLGGETLSE